MFKTARFRLHNPSRHKTTMLRYAMERYHGLVKQVVETALSDSGLATRISIVDKNGVARVSGYALQKLLYALTPKGGPIAPLRDYAVADATAMLLSHFKKVEKGKNISRPPRVAALVAPSADEKAAHSADFATRIEFPLKPQHEEKIREASEKGRRRVAARLTAIYRGWAATRAAGELLRSLEAPLPRPVEFTRPEFGRGYLLARKGTNYYLLVRLFSKGHRYWAGAFKLDDGFINIRTGSEIGGKKYPGLVFPLELGREFHEEEYIANGRPQSAKIVMMRDKNGEPEFFVHVAFEFEPQAFKTTRFLGIDRGAAMIGAGTILDEQGRVLGRVDLEGAAFAREMARYRERIAEQQRKGIQKSRKFKVRGRRADILIGEYANRLIAAALEYKAQIVLEKINAVVMGRFLSQSQFRKLHSALTYKAARVGLPEPMEVPAARTSQTCGQCGHWDPASRPKTRPDGTSVQDQFCCTQCNHQENADVNASRVIALRGLHQALKGGRFRKFGEFQAWLRDLTRQDGSAGSPGVGL